MCVCAYTHTYIHTLTHTSTQCLLSVWFIILENLTVVQFSLFKGTTFSTHDLFWSGGGLAHTKAWVFKWMEPLLHLAHCSFCC